MDESIKFIFTEENKNSIVFELLTENHALLQLILENQSKLISKETGELYEEVLVRMNERYQKLRLEISAQKYSQYGTPDVNLPRA